MTHDRAALDAYNADINAARNAYAMDRAVAAGMCAVCQTRKVHDHCRRCWTCLTSHIKENPHV